MCIPFEYEAIAKIIEAKAKAPKKEAPKKEEKSAAKKEEIRPEVKKLKELMKKDNISLNRLIFAVCKKTQDFTATSLEGLDPNFIQNSLIDKWDKFVGYAKKFTEAEVESMEVPFE